MPFFLLSISTVFLFAFARVLNAAQLKNASYVDSPEEFKVADILPPPEFFTDPILDLVDTVMPAENVNGLSERCKDELRRIEGFSAKPYVDPPGQNKLYSIGYGYQLRTGEWYENISIADAERLLDKVLEEIYSNLSRRVAVPLSQNQFDAVVLFHYNIGQTQFNNSTFLRKLNAGDYAGAAAEFKRWNKANNQVNNALVERRAFEERLFLT